MSDQPAPRRSHRSTAVRLALVPILAASFTACGGEDETAYCVDDNDKVVENRNCDDRSSAGGFFWFFGGAGGRLGARVPGGGSGQRIRANDTAALNKRGGFGSSARSSGGVGRSVSGGRSGGGFSGGG